MTIPKGFKRSAKPPAELVLHKATLPKKEIMQMHGYRMTTVKRALEDIAQDGTLSKDIIEQAVRDALKTGHLSIADFEKSEILRPYRSILRPTSKREAS